MKIWKPLTKFMKQRKEWAWHHDFALEPGEALTLIIGGHIHHLDRCPKGQELKIHLMICVEPFDTDVQQMEVHSFNIPEESRSNL